MINSRELRFLHPIKCGCCDVLFTPVLWKKIGGKKIKYCSSQCRALSYHRRKNGGIKVAEKLCEICSNIFTNDKFHPNARTCSKSCCDKLDYKENKQKRINYSKQWIKNNPELVRQYHRTNYKNTIEQKRLQKRVRATASITETQWIAICEKSHHFCVQCYEKFDIKDLTIDHILPVSLGGANDIENLQPLCFPCNRLKGNRWIGTIPIGIYRNMVSK
jgi:5-methylcytosine-specific restriction endonuclease McrA